MWTLIYKECCCNIHSTNYVKFTLVNLLHSSGFTILKHYSFHIHFYCCLNVSHMSDNRETKQFGGTKGHNKLGKNNVPVGVHISSELMHLSHRLDPLHLVIIFSLAAGCQLLLQPLLRHIQITSRDCV